MPGKHVVLPIVLAKWIAVFRGIADGNSRQRLFSKCDPFFAVLHFPG